MTPSEAVLRLNRFIVAERNAILRGLKRGVGRARKPALERLRASGVGRALTTRKKGLPGTPRLIVSVSRAKQTGPESFEVALQAKGMAALIDQGGRTKPHAIEAKSDQLLSFQARDGRSVHVRRVSHPGSNVPRVSSLEPALRGAEPGVAREIQLELGNAVKEVGLDG